MKRFLPGSAAPLAVLTVSAAGACAWHGVAGVALLLIVILAPLLVLRPGFWLVLRPLSRRCKLA